MTDFTITNGTASYSRVRQPAAYESQNPSVVLQFEVAQGADPEKVVAKVMQIAKDAVENVFSTNSAPSVDQASSLPAQTQGKRKAAPTGAVPEATVPSTALVPASEPAAADALSALAGESKPEPAPAAQPTPEDDLAALSGEPATGPKEYSTEDLKTALMQTSAHLRKTITEGNANAPIQKLLASFGVAGWAALKPEQYGDFIEKLKGLVVTS